MERHGLLRSRQLSFLYYSLQNISFNESITVVPKPGPRSLWGPRRVTGGQGRISGGCENLFSLVRLVVVLTHCTVYDCFP